MNLDGVVIVDKPEGWTSHDVVSRLRGIFGTRRTGHLGTLDPIATGVLPVMIGQATRLARFFEKSDKSYEAVVRFGFATTTYDRAGEPCGPVTEPCITAEMIEACLGSMRGRIQQIPPPVSAKKVGGVPAYKLARRNASVDLAPVGVTVYELTLIEVEGTRARLRIRCSAGTYVRAIAHQLGMLLGCGAHVSSLIRTASGSFDIERAFTLERLQALRNSEKPGEGLESALIPAASLLPEFPVVLVDEGAVAHIRQGRDFTVSAFRADAGAEHVKAVGQDGRLIAIGRISLPHVYHPVVVMSGAA